jgi:polysaccharide export outer membrane protein
MADDVVYVSRDQKAFLTFGATPTPGAIGGLNNRRFNFEAENLTLAEAVAKAGGMESTRADPSSVFLFRLVPREQLRRIGVEVSGGPNTMVPTIFTAMLRNPEGFFVANNFYMRDKDMILVSDTPSTDLVKFLDIVRAVTNTTREVIGIGIDWKAL